jgi:hypothetical protein
MEITVGYRKIVGSKEVSLKISDENLYRMVRYPHCSAFECWDEEDWDMEFRRSLSVQEYNSWLDLTISLQGCKPEGEANDIVSWALEPRNHFSTKSLYRFLTDRGMPSRVAGLIWKCKIPLKIKFFLWQVFHNKL